MALYRIDVGDGTDINTVVADVGWRFSKNLNQINEAELKFSGTGEARRALLGIGSTVTIYKDGVIAFKGLIDNTDYFIGGTIVFHASGWEVWMAKEPGAYSGSPWTATASATIFSEIIAESSYISAGTIEAGYSMDYRLTTSQTLWNAMSNLANKTSQDVSIDYTADPVEMSILDHTGSSTSVAVLNEGKEITNLRRSQGYPRGNSIIIKGKGDGTDQITATDSDATSIAAYGTITKTIVDRSIMTTAEATRLAAAELAMNKDPPNIYDFDLTNPDYATLNLGDIITLNALDQDVTNEEVRIVGIEEGKIGGKAFITLQVTNPALKRLMRTKNKIMAQLKKDQDDNQTYMQGSGNTNTWGAGINAKTNYPLKIGFFLPEGYIKNEAGNSNVSELSVSYDLDKFKSEFGTASFSGTDPQVQNDSGNTSPDVTGDSGNTSPDVTGDSGSIGADVAGYTSDNDADVANSSGSESASVTGTSSSSGATSWSSDSSGDSASVGTGTLYDSAWTTITNTGTIGVASDLILYFVTFKNDNAISTRIIRVRANMNGTYYPNSAGTYTEVNPQCYVTIPILIPANVLSQDIYVQAQTESGNMDYEFTWNYQVIGKHTHADGSYASASHSHDDGTYNAVDHDHASGTYAAASHSHDDGTYDAASHSHDDGTFDAASHGHPDGTYDINAADLDHISIADDVSEAGSVNASSVNIYLDFWNTGTSAWDNKHSVMATGVTIETDVDISDSGTYPDAAGFWRVRIEPITATADFAQGIVKIKNAVDN